MNKHRLILYTYYTWHRQPKNYLKACLKLRFFYLSLSSKTQIGASTLLSMRAPQYFD